jgi:hypothetical protein
MPFVSIILANGSSDKGNGPAGGTPPVLPRGKAGLPAPISGQGRPGPVSRFSGQPPSPSPLARCHVYIILIISK